LNHAAADQRRKKRERRRKKDEKKRKKKEQRRVSPALTSPDLAGARLAGSRWVSPETHGLFVCLFFFPIVGLAASPHRRRPWFFLGFFLVLG
jgi:hypothetical protein